MVLKRNELAHIWADYILANERELNGDAIKFKKYTLYVNGKRTSMYTFVSHGTKEEGDNLLNKMKSQLDISREELNDLIDCPLKHEDLIRILAGKNKI